MVVGIGSVKGNAVVVPATYEEKPVIGIKNAFVGCTQITSVTISEGIVNIESEAFKNCTALETIVLPNSLQNVGANAFSGCSALVRISYTGTQESLDALLPNIQENFGNVSVMVTCLTCVPGEIRYEDEIPSTCAQKGSCAKVVPCAICGKELSRTTVELALSSHTPSQNDKAKCGVCGLVMRTSAGLELAYNTSAGTYTVVGIGTCTDTDVYIGICEDGKRVTAIAENAFKKTGPSMSGGVFVSGKAGGNFTSVIIDDCVTSIGAGAFATCSKLETIVLPANLKSIERSTFSGCSSLKNISLPASVKTIGKSAFSGCSSLQSIAFPNAITRIEESVFSGCTALKSFTIGPNVTSIGAYAFKGCAALTSLVMQNTGVTTWELRSSSFSTTFAENKIYSDPSYAANIFTQEKNIGPFAGNDVYYYHCTWTAGSLS